MRRFNVGDSVEIEDDSIYPHFGTITHIVRDSDTDSDLFRIKLIGDSELAVWLTQDQIHLCF